MKTVTLCLDTTGFQSAPIVPLKKLMLFSHHVGTLFTVVIVQRLNQPALCVILLLPAGKGFISPMTRSVMIGLARFAWTLKSTLHFPHVDMFVHVRNVHAIFLTAQCARHSLPLFREFMFSSLNNLVKVMMMMAIIHLEFGCSSST